MGVSSKKLSEPVAHVRRIAKPWAYEANGGERPSQPGGDLTVAAPQPREHAIPYLLGGAFHNLAFTTWGDPHAQPVLCVHGLTRNGRDFDVLANALADEFYLICPDLPGRGKSAWLADPALYQPPGYVQALAHLLAFIDRPVHWIGTSLGGICAMIAAATPGNPIRRIVLNDVGPFIPRAALARIASYVGATPVFADLVAAEHYFRGVHAAFGALSDAQWRHMAQTSVRALPDGTLRLHYDPAIATPFQSAAPQDVDMWALWDAIEVPMLVLRGEHSDLLLADTFLRMESKATNYTVPDCGHAPALMDARTIGVVREFISKEAVLF
jgi:pimeloyl-ACP methyl ester carboxylesterase